ncbi:MAG: N-acetylmuramoyl-L-alanine amidase [Candidatus Limnocylindria bacterium]
MTRAARRGLAALIGAGLVVVACTATVSPSPSPSVSVQPSPTPEPTPGVGDVVPAPGSTSTVYGPNPGAIVVAIDPGHGGCLDWGVPDPERRGVDFSEKTMTLAIALELQRLLEAQGITVVMTRTDDSALAGDDYPDLGCHGPPWRDVNGDGEAGFDDTGASRTRDELQARIDLVNLARADLLVSIHVNSLVANGVVVEAAATLTYYTDEVPWGLSAGFRLGHLVQDGVVDALDGVATYERQDRGVEPVNFYIIGAPLYVPTEERPDPRKQPTRGILMPGVLTEVGSITLAAEHDLLGTAVGQAAAAEGIFDGLADYLANRPISVRYDALIPGGSAGGVAEAVDGLGPPYWAVSLDGLKLPDGLPIRLTNTGTTAWPTGLQLMGGWSATDQPYLRSAPEAIESLGAIVPPLGPGESVELRLPLAIPDLAGPQVLWISVSGTNGTWTDLGVAPLQLTFQAR